MAKRVVSARVRPEEPDSRRVAVVIRVPPRVLGRLADAAQLEGRTPSELVERALMRWAKGRGIL